MLYIQFLEILSVYFTSYIVNENFFIYSTGRDGEVIKKEQGLKVQLYKKLLTNESTRKNWHPCYKV